MQGQYQTLCYPRFAVLGPGMSRSGAIEAISTVLGGVTARVEAGV